MGFKDNEIKMLSGQQALIPQLKSWELICLMHLERRKVKQ